MIRTDWTREEVKKIYLSPILELIGRANATHRQHHDPNFIQKCQLISVKTGGCPEDCKYCSQSSFYKTPVAPQPMLPRSEVIALAKQAIARGATRICLGAAWRGVKAGKAFNAVLEMIKALNALGVEVCCTLGLLTEEHAHQLKAAGLYAYNHNLDTSESYYRSVITTRTYADRLRTLDAVEKSGLSVCCGALFGMGESVDDRIALLHTLATRTKHPDSVPINRLNPVPGTPYADLPLLSIWEVLRSIATARILMPRAYVRLSTTRHLISQEQHTLCFLAGANSIFLGKMLTILPNATLDQDSELFSLLGAQPCTQP